MQGFLWECNSPISRRCCWFLRYWTTTRSIGPEIIIPNALWSVSTVHKVCFNRTMQPLNVLSAGAQYSVLINAQLVYFHLKSLAAKPIYSVFSFSTWGWTQSTNKRAETIAWFYFTNARTYILYTMFGSFFTIKYILRFQIRLNKVRFPSSRIDEPPDLFSKSEAPRGI